MVAGPRMCLRRKRRKRKPLMTSAIPSLAQMGKPVRGVTLEEASISRTS